MKNYDNVVVFNHPLINHKIAILFNWISIKQFRDIHKVATLGVGNLFYTSLSHSECSIIGE